MTVNISFDFKLVICLAVIAEQPWKVNWWTAIFYARHFDDELEKWRLYVSNQEKYFRYNGH